MSLLYFVIWALLLVVSSKIKSIFLFYFVLFQFLFIGCGLSLFPFLGIEYLEKNFSAFDFSCITNYDFNYASFLVLLGTFLVVVFYYILINVLYKNNKPVYIINNCNHDFFYFEKIFLIFVIVLSFCISLPFIINNYSGLLYLVLADNVYGLSGFVDFRSAATENYFLVLFVYNILPAFSLVSFLCFLRNKTFFSFLLFSFYFLLASVNLLLTYQKRPILVFFGSLFLLSYLCNSSFKKKYCSYKVDIFKLISKNMIKIFFVLFLLLVFYYFYTSYRFYSSIFETFFKLYSVIFLRIFGRLSIPAAMYVNFFPAYNDFYGLTNVGLLSKFFGVETFLDSKVVFSHFSLYHINGSVAASFFIDAYGQGGLICITIYSFLLAFIILFLDFIAIKTINVYSRSFFVVTGFIFVYYLSQASIFRSLLGYGAFFYFSVWLLVFKCKIQKK